MVIFDLPGVDADSQCHPQSLRRIVDRVPAADGSNGAVEHGEELVPDHIHLLPTVAGQLLAGGRRQRIVARDEVIICTKGGYVPLAASPPATRDEYLAYLYEVREEPARMVTTGPALAELSGIMDAA